MADSSEQVCRGVTRGQIGRLRRPTRGLCGRVKVWNLCRNRIAAPQGGRGRWQRESLAVPSRRCGGPSVWARLGGLGRSVVQGCLLAPCPFHHTPRLGNPGTSQKPLPRRDSKRDGRHGAGQPERKDSHSQPGESRRTGQMRQMLALKQEKSPYGGGGSCLCCRGPLPLSPACEPQSRLGERLRGSS
jgi:hypothetical protein